MAARWLQQKIAKQKRDRRKWAKAYSMKGTGPTSNPGYMADDGKFVSISTGSRTKVARSAPNFDTMDRHLLATFKPTSVEAVYARLSGLHTDLKPQVILAKQKQSTNGAGTLQGEIKYVYFLLKKEPNYEARLYMCADSAFIYLEIITDTHRVYKRSSEFGSRHQALDAWKIQRIHWDKIERIPKDSLG